MDSAQASAASLALVGTTIADRYRLDKLIGEGGMGAVFQATHLLMRKRVAVKLLHADLSHDEEVLGRFRREAQAAARIEHPNVAAATDFGQLPDGSFFLVLEFVEGIALNEVIVKGPLDAARALHIVRQIAVALEKAHEVGVIHRDLKPDNIMLVRKDADPDFVKVLDFGIAKLDARGAPPRDGKQLVTRFGTILGTPEYMSPEQAAGEPAGAGADFYSVGVMLYEMLTQKLPFDDPDRTRILSLHIISPPPKMSDRAPGIDVPSPIERLTLALLAKEPKDRPESAGALRAAIESAGMEAGLNLPHFQSTRALPRDVASEPALPAASTAPTWKPTDALAKTQIGIPTEHQTIAVAPLPSALLESSSPTQATGVPGLRLGPIDKLPRPLAFAALGAPFFIAAFIVVVILSLVSHHAPTTGDDGEGGADAEAPPLIKPETPSKAPWAKIAAAKAGGLAAMEQLLAQFPEDDNVQAELADSAVVAAQRPDTAEDAFAILENELGSRGVDGLMELASGANVPRPAKLRATASLAKPEIRAKASPAAGVALDLRASYKCQVKHDLLASARESGDTRSLQLLKDLKWTRGCGIFKRSDCWECLRHDSDLDDAIAAVKSRQPLERDR